ncbi:MAG: hypothetical protein R2764_08165 [Bacteroidales bacterium]
MKEKIISILLNPIFIALTISSVLIYLLPNYFSRYKADLLENGVYHKGRISYFIDLNGDNISEQIVCGESNSGNAYFQVFTFNGSIIDQWNFYGHFPSYERKIWSSDVNTNNSSEIYIITQKNDSAFLHIIEPMKADGINLRKKFITTIQGKDNHFDFKPYTFFISDLDKDNFNDIVFSINAGFGVFPRSIYSYNLRKDTVQSSPFLGNYAFINEIIDINEDRLS